MRDFRLTGDKADLELYQEYQRATKGRQAITWSAGLRKRLLAELHERSDEELAAEEVGGDPQFVISPDAWRQLTRTRWSSTGLLSAGDRGGLPAVEEAAAGLWPRAD